MRAAKASSAWDLVVCPVGGAGSGGFGASVTVPGFSTGPNRGGGVAAASSTGTLPAASGTGRACNVRASMDLASGREDCSRFGVFGGHPVASNWSGCPGFEETGLVTGGASRGWTVPFGCTAAGDACVAAAARCQSKAAPLAGAVGISSGTTSGATSGALLGATSGATPGAASGTEFGITLTDSENTAGGAGGGVVDASTKQSATKPAVSEAGLSFSASDLGGSPFRASAGRSGSDVPPASCCGSAGRAWLRKKAKVSPVAGSGTLSCFRGAPPAARRAWSRAGNSVASGREPEQITNRRLQIERHWRTPATQRVSGTRPVKKLPDRGIRQNIVPVDHGPPSF